MDSKAVELNRTERPKRRLAASDDDYRAAIEGAAWSGNVLILPEEKVEKRLRRSQLSHSASSSIHQCPASWAASALLPKIERPLDPNVLGSGAHALLEAMYNQPKPARTKSFLRQNVRRIADSELAGFENIPDFEQIRAEYRKKTLDLALHIFDVEEPSSIDIVANELHAEGVEIAGVPVNCYIDRIRRDPKTGLLIVEDYKFGKWKRPNPRFGDDYAHQGRLYFDVVEAVLEEQPGEVNLIYPHAQDPEYTGQQGGVARSQGVVRAIDTSESQRKATRVRFRKAWDAMNTYADKRQYPTQPSNLCGWCPLANSCPVAKIQSDKAIEEAKKQPSKVALGIPTVRPQAEPRITKTGTQDSQEKTMTAPAAPSAAPAAAKTTKTRAQAPAQAQAPAVQYPTGRGVERAIMLASFAASHLAYNGVPAGTASITSFAKLLASIVRKVALQTVGSFDFDHSATDRLLFAVQSTIKEHPAPFGSGVEEWKRWAASAAELTRIRFLVGINLHAAESVLVDEDDFNLLASLGGAQNNVTPIQAA